MSTPRMARKEKLRQARVKAMFRRASRVNLLTICSNLASKLGRDPTDAELDAECARLIGEHDRQR